MGDGVARNRSDVVVVGAGMGGLVAAIAAQEEGSQVTLLDKAAEPGGSLAISGGYVWTLPTLEDYKRLVPFGDQDLGRILVEDFPTGIEWLAQHGVRLGPHQGGLGPDRVGEGRRIEPDPVSGAVQPLLEAFRSGGGHLVCRSPVIALEQDAGGGVRGVRFRSDVRTAKIIESSSTVLSTGGFQGDSEMMARYVSPWADRALLRSSPACTGDGFRMALDAGASTSAGLNAVYGHVMPTLPEQLEPAAFRAMTQFYVEECILLNLLGERFVDESKTDAVCGIALLREPEARGFIVFDELRHQTKVMEPFVPDAAHVDPVTMIRGAGGEVLVAGSLEELCHQLELRGVPFGTALRTIRQFDAAAEAGDGSTLPIPRAASLHTCRKPPFFVVPVRPGVTFTEGGIRVNTECQALDRDGRPIRGLFIAGVDVGAVSNVGYVGALSAALITGLRAGIHAARSSQASQAG